MIDGVVRILVLAALVPSASGVGHGDFQCWGTDQEDGSKRFQVPAYVAKEAKHHSCYIQWIIDGIVSADIHGGRMDITLPAKNATVDSLTTDSCPTSVEYSVDCTDTNFIKRSNCSCTNSTADSWEAHGNSGAATLHSPAERDHYVLILPFLAFGIIIIFLSVQLYRNRGQKQHAEHWMRQPEGTV